MAVNQIFIPFNVPSSKNSKQWTGKFLVSSASVMKWRKKTEPYWIENKAKFLKMVKSKSKPHLIGLHFVRDSKRLYDFVNPVQTIQDEMKRHGWILDDNITQMIPVPTERDGSYWSVDRENPGVFITVL